MQSSVLENEESSEPLEIDFQSNDRIPAQLEINFQFNDRNSGKAFQFGDPNIRIRVSGSDWNSNQSNHSTIQESFGTIRGFDLARWRLKSIRELEAIGNDFDQRLGTERTIRNSLL